MPQRKQRQTHATLVDANNLNCEHWESSDRQPCSALPAFPCLACISYIALGLAFPSIQHLLLDRRRCCPAHLPRPSSPNQTTAQVASPSSPSATAQLVPIIPAGNTLSRFSLPPRSITHFRQFIAGTFVGQLHARLSDLINLQVFPLYFQSASKSSLPIVSRSATRPT